MNDKDKKEEEKTIAEKINFSGKGKAEQRKKQRKKMYDSISEALGLKKKEEEEKKD